MRKISRISNKMAENIEMEDMGREDNHLPEETPEGGETSFIEPDADDNLLGDRSVHIIDTSVPNVRRDVATFKRAYTHDKKHFLRDNLNIRLHKGDGLSSTILFDNIELTMSSHRTRVNGMKYKGVNIIVYRDGKLDYSTAKANVSIVSEFKRLVRRAELEHERTAAALLEEQADVSDDTLVRSIICNSERLESFIDDEYERVVQQASELKLSGNELREVRGISEGGINKQKGITDEQRIEFLEVDRRHWLELTSKEQDSQKAKFYESVSRIASLEQDNIRLRLNLRPESMDTNSIISSEVGREVQEVG